MIVEQLTSHDGDLPGPLLTELAALYASHDAFRQLGGERAGADGGSADGPEQLAASLADELAHPGAEVLLARSAGRLVAVAVTRTGPVAVEPGFVEPGLVEPGFVRARTPETEAAEGAETAEAATADAREAPYAAEAADPWIGLLLVHGELRRSGYGRRLAEIVESRFRAAGATGVRLAVPEDNSVALAFWTALGYGELSRENGAPHGHRPGTTVRVLRKDLTVAGDAGRR